ncbi:ATP-binding cassette domain-containing protein [Marinomonas sp. GJ51-6]|uniref:ATP-binding cassette domain-containing protein n=1 Tax=Marinomonas sp. GJ51-6 TaxID=2992802 RepID=UPI0039775526
MDNKPLESESSTGAAYVSMKGVGHKYDPRPDAAMAVQNIDLDIHRHEFVSVVGSSGCGKSTLLRMVAGLLIPSHGEVSVFNRPVTEPRDDVGIVFQKANLLPWLTVRKNVLFPLKHKYGSYSASDERRANEAPCNGRFNAVRRQDARRAIRRYATACWYRSRFAIEPRHSING